MGAIPKGKGAVEVAMLFPHGDQDWIWSVGLNGTGAVKTLTTHGINKQENCNPQPAPEHNSKLKQTAHSQWMRLAFQNKWLSMFRPTLH